MRIRIKFAKKEDVQYLGHLDIMRFFQRCFNRADVKMEYSIGYNPHQKMSFAQPLGVGILSRGEYLDAEIADGQDLDQICANLNGVCGSGFEIENVRAVEEGARKAMAALAFASYKIDVSRLVNAAGTSEAAEAPSDQLLSKALADLLAKQSIPTLKTTKSGTREVDIRPQIIKAEYADGIVSLTVTAGSDNNLKPDTFLAALFAETGIEYSREMVTITREDLYAEGFIPLDQYQTTGASA